MKPRRYIVGCLAAWALWIVFIAIDHAHSVFRSDLPKAIRPVADLVTSVMGMAAWPFAWGLWWLAGERYLGLIQNVPLNIAIGLVVWGALGALAARHWGAIASITHRALRAVRPRFSKRDVLWIVVIVVILAGGWSTGTG